MTREADALLAYVDAVNEYADASLRTLEALPILDPTPRLSDAMAAQVEAHAELRKAQRNMARVMRGSWLVEA